MNEHGGGGMVTLLPETYETSLEKGGEGGYSIVLMINVLPAELVNDSTKLHKTC